MRSNANPDREKITVNIGNLKRKLLIACEEDRTNPTVVVNQLIDKWLKARDRQRQREAKAEKEIAAKAATESKSKPD